VAWVEFDGGGYSEPCTRDAREGALDGALHALIDHYMGIIGRLGELPAP
jgi:hypothetical protein